MSAGSDVERGSARDFEAFYRGEYERLVRVAVLLVGDAGDPEGLAQESFARVHVRFETLHNPRAYVRRTLVNLCRRHQRRASTECRLRERTHIEESVTDETRELLDIVDRLPYRQKAVVVLRYYDDLSEEVIAEVLGCRPGTVKSLAHRALERLRKELSS
jgi:RNA polymerase sigma-70 factor (sigma-E family)